MMLWIGLSVLLAATVVIAGWPFAFRPKAAGGGESRVYRAQLGEVAREQTAGLMSEDDARTARTEIERRLIAAQDAPAPKSSTTMTRLDRMVLLGVVAFIAVGSGILYTVIGHPSTPAAPRGAGAGGAGAQQLAAPGGQMNLPSVDDMNARLEAKLKENPKDVESWRMLGWSRYRTDDYAGAAKAYAEALKLAPEDAESQSSYGEALTRAAGGLVTKDALAALEHAVKLDRRNARARFLLGLKQEQDGKPAAAIDAWVALLKEATADDDWYDDVRGRVVELADTAHIDVSKRLPPPRSADQSRKGPSSSDIAQAQAMPDADRQAMIANMVSGLDARLKANPNDIEGWLKLIHARRVLGQNDLAADAASRGRQAFRSDSAALARIAAAASEPLDRPSN